MSRPKRRRSKKAAPGKVKISRIRSIILIDHAPLRRKAIAEYEKNEKKVGGLREKVEEFEQKDIPAYERWRAAAFGPLLTELRELTSKIHEQEDLIAEVEDEVYFSQTTYATAYRRVMEDREIEKALFGDEEDEDEEGHDFGDQENPFSDGPPDEEQLEEMFHDLLTKVMGIDPDHLDDLAYEEGFRKFKEGIVGGKGFEGFDPQGWGPPFDDERPERVFEPPTAEGLRAKELYRKLARRLHPDLNGHEPRLLELWHQAQEAYEQDDIERLETLLARSDLLEGNLGDHVPLGHILQINKELRSAIRRLQKNLRQAKEHEAWEFSQKGDHPRFKRSYTISLKQQIAIRRKMLEEMLQRIAKWASGGKRRRKSTKAGSASSGNAPDKGQMEFTF